MHTDAGVGPDLGLDLKYSPALTEVRIPGRIGIAAALGLVFTGLLFVVLVFVIGTIAMERRPG